MKELNYIWKHKEIESLSKMEMITEHNRIMRSLGNILHNFTTELYYSGNQEMSSKLEDIISELWDCKS